MPSSFAVTFRRLTLVSAALLALPASLTAQQDRPGAVLPPPSLYDVPTPGAESSVPAPIRAVPPPTSAPAPTTAAPVSALPQTAAPMPLPRATVPANTAQPAAIPARTVQPAPVQSAPTPTVRVAPTPIPPAQPVATQREPATPVKELAGRAGGPFVNSGYVYDRPEGPIRTGYGSCIRTSYWDPRMATEQCDPRLVAKKTVPQPTVTALAAPPTAVRTIEPAPAVVKPLAPQPARQERALEAERVSAVPAPVAGAPVQSKSARLPPAKSTPLQSVTLSGDTLFPLDSFHLKASARERLDALLAKVQNMKYETIKVIGHTDPTGTEALNKRLSWQRAEVVKGYLVARGLDASKIETEGVGSADPAVTKDCAALPRAQKIACYQPDRRVQIDVQGFSANVAGSMTTSQRSK